MKKDINTILVSPDHTIRETMEVINNKAKGFALVVDDQRKILGFVADGDIRRALLCNESLTRPIGQIMNREPICCAVGTPNLKLLEIMNEKSIRQIPILDEDGRVVDVVLFSELAKDEIHLVSAIILAGGLGTRLRPLTEEIPKPLLKVGKKPIVESVLDQISASGIHDVIIATGYKAEQIEEHFQYGKYGDINIKFVRENMRLGTAGPIALAKEFLSEPVLVINGDILTRLNFRRMLEFHYDNESVMTVAVKQFDYKIPYGVIDVDGSLITGIVEKPIYSFYINAGIYLMTFKAIERIPDNIYVDMTDVIKQLVKEGHKVCSFPICEYWLDVGKPEDFEQANSDVLIWESQQ